MIKTFTLVSALFFASTGAFAQEALIPGQVYAAPAGAGDCYSSSSGRALTISAINVLTVTGS